MVIKVSDLRNTKDGRTYADLSDRMLVLDFQAGNPEAFVEIHRRYAGLARHVSQRILGNPDDADEAAQETMIRVFQGLNRFNGRYALQPWVARIATNVSLDLTRARARRPQMGDRPIQELPDEKVPLEEDETVETVERLLECDRVQEVLSSMPSRHRDALVLREFEGLSHKEIGEALGVTPPQAKALIHRAKGTFRRLWDGRDETHRGLAAIFPFVLLDRVSGLFRRVADRATEAGQQLATSQAATAAASNPMVPAAASQTAERFVAAATITAIVAGSVTVGAATLTHRKAEPVAASSSPVERIVPVAATPIHKPKAHPTKVKPAKAERQAGVPGGTQSPAPDQEPTPSPTDSPSGSPTPEPSAPPTESPTPPPIPPAPAWSGAFGIKWTSTSSCECGPGVSASTSTTGQLTADKTLDVKQSLSGAAQDAEGDAAWSLNADLYAHLAAKSGRMNLVFLLGDENGTHGYAGYASSVAEVDGVVGDGNAVTYIFTGNYTLEQGDSATSPIPVEGSFTVRIGVWGDGTSVHYSSVQLLG
jgi:RNA polymerase sigma-70 factor (ECF subfamily)